MHTGDYAVYSAQQGRTAWVNYMDHWPGHYYWLCCHRLRVDSKTNRILKKRQAGRSEAAPSCSFIF